MSASASSVLLLALSCAFLASPVSAVGAPANWTQAPSLPAARSDFRALTLGDGVYLLGGCVSNQTVGGSCSSFSQALTLYNLTTGVYSDLTSLSTLSAPIRTRYGAAIMGTDLLFIGGRDDNDNILASMDVYSTTTKSWLAPATVSAQNSLQRSDGCAFVIGSSVFYAGGYDAGYTAFSDVYYLDTSLTPNEGKTYGALQAKVVANKPYPSGDCGAVAIYGKGYVFGGFTNDGFVAPVDWLERYDPSTNSWSVLKNMIHPRGAAGYAVLAGNLFVVGGETKILKKNATTTVNGTVDAVYWSTATGEVEHYNIITDSWTEVSDLAVKRFRTSAAPFAAQNRIINFGGQGEPVITNSADLVNGAYFPVLTSVYSLDVTQWEVDTKAADTGNGQYSGKVGGGHGSAAHMTAQTTGFAMTAIVTLVSLLVAAVAM